MKKALVERNMVVILFVLVMVVFSFAKRDTAKLFENNNVKAVTDLSFPPKRVLAEVKAPLQKTVSTYSKY